MAKKQQPDIKTIKEQYEQHINKNYNYRFVEPKDNRWFFFLSCLVLNMLDKILTYIGLHKEGVKEMSWLISITIQKVGLEWGIIISFIFSTLLIMLAQRYDKTQIIVPILTGGLLLAMIINLQILLFM